jgi:hypothetical protein
MEHFGLFPKTFLFTLQRKLERSELPMKPEASFFKRLGAKFGAYRNFCAWATMGLAQLAPRRDLEANSRLDFFKNCPLELTVESSCARLNAVVWLYQGSML